MKSLAAALIFTAFSCSSAHARVFNFNNTWISAYFRGTGGLSSVANDAYADTSGSGTAFDEEVDYNFSGEIGFALQLGEVLVMRAGVEGLQAKNITATGTNATGTTEYMDVDSKAVAFNPNLTFEYSFRNSGTSRFSVFGGAGYSNVKVTNDYAVTAAGIVAYPTAPASYKETWSADVINYTLGAGFEIFILDNVTFSIDGGWRFFDISSFEYDTAVSVLRAGAMQNVAAGSMVRDNAGNKVDMDLGGPFVGITFKFYIPPLD